MNPQHELEALLNLFPEQPPLIQHSEHLPAALLPQSYRTMLAHDHHMTVTMEKYHNSPVDVVVLEEHHNLESDCYDRKILLRPVGTERNVQFGIVRFHFEYVTKAVRREILEKQIPLGRVLINHNVLRHIDLGALFRFTAGHGLAKHLQMPEGTDTYGRLATIFCNRQPAVDLLEISAPLPEDD